MDLKSYEEKYYYVSRDELVEIRDTLSVLGFNEMEFECQVKSLHQSREKEEKQGRASLRPGPLLQVLSLRIQSEYKVHGVYGRVYVQYDDDLYYGDGKTVLYDIYKRERDNLEVLGSSGALTLTGPDYSCWPYVAYMPLGKGRLMVELFDEVGNVFIEKSIDLKDVEVENEFDQVKSLVIHGKKRGLIVAFHVIPLGVFSRVEVQIIHKKASGKENCFMDVYGKIVARYGNFFVDNSSIESTLFEKQSNELERVANDSGNLALSKSFVCLPAYTSLCIDLELFEFGTGRKLVSGTTEFLPKQGLVYGDTVVFNNLVVQVSVAWFSPSPQGPVIRYRKIEGSTSAPAISKDEINEMDVEGEDQSTSGYDSDDSDDDESNASQAIWTLSAHKKMLSTSQSVEIFSVLIGRVPSELKLYGSIEVMCDYKSLYIFKRDRSDALFLSENMKSIPILHGSLMFEECDSLEMIVDLKDVEDRLTIKGYVDWAPSVLESSHWHDKQLCSLIQGQNGFAALHYSIFSEAVEASLQVFCKLKVGSSVELTRVHGYIVVQYGCFDYSSAYNRDNQRIILLKNTQEDALQLGGDGRLLLSRSTVVVPSYTSLIVDLDLSFGVSHQRVSYVKEVSIGESSITIDANESSIYIEIDWHEVK